MSMKQLVYTKKWTDPSKFPTYESDETQVRKDMQCLYDEIEVWANNLVTNTSDGISAQNIPYTDTEKHITGETVSEGMQNLWTQMQKIQAKGVLQNSITDIELDSKPGEEAVVTSTIRDSAVTNSKIEDRAIDSNKLAIHVDATETDPEILAAVATANIRDKAIKTAKIDDKAVDTSQIADFAVEHLQIGISAVETSNIHDLHVTEGKLAKDSVTKEKIKDGEVSKEKVDFNYAGSASKGGSASSVANSLTFNNGGSGAASGTTFDGSSAKTISYNTVGAASAGHTHNYAGAGSSGGAATSANKVNASVTFNNDGSGAASGTTFDGSSAKTISYNTVGAAAASHNQSAGTITAGTLQGDVKAKDPAVGSAYIRNIYAGTGAMTAGSTALTTGMIYLQYE